MWLWWFWIKLEFFFLLLWASPRQNYPKRILFCQILLICHQFQNVPPGCSGEILSEMIYIVCSLLLFICWFDFSEKSWTNLGFVCCQISWTNLFLLSLWRFVFTSPLFVFILWLLFRQVIAVLMWSRWKYHVFVHVLWCMVWICFHLICWNW